jgi:hypothetical protein
VCGKLGALANIPRETNTQRRLRVNNEEVCILVLAHYKIGLPKRMPKHIFDNKYFLT